MHVTSYLLVCWISFHLCLIYYKNFIDNMKLSFYILINLNITKKNQQKNFNTDYLRKTLYKFYNLYL